MKLDELEVGKVYCTSARPVHTEPNRDPARMWHVRLLKIGYGPFPHRAAHVELVAGGVSCGQHAMVGRQVSVGDRLWLSGAYFFGQLEDVESAWQAHQARMRVVNTRRQDMEAEDRQLGAELARALSSPPMLVASPSPPRDAGHELPGTTVTLHNVPLSTLGLPEHLGGEVVVRITFDDRADVRRALSALRDSR